MQCTKSKGDVRLLMCFTNLSLSLFGLQIGCNGVRDGSQRFLLKTDITVRTRRNLTSKETKPTALNY